MTDTAVSTASVDDPKELGGIVQRWIAELGAYEKDFKDWRKDTRNNYQRYSLRDRTNQPETTADSRFNILWSNTRTESPALFSRPPTPIVERRFRDKDMVGRIASQMLERAISTDMDEDDIEILGKQLTLDFQLAGRGVPWVRYKAEIIETEAEVFPTEFGMVDTDGNAVEEAEEQDDGSFIVRSEEVASERAPVDYVYWEDFYHKPVKFWKELERDGWVARRVFMTRRQGIERFGEIFRDVPLKSMPKGFDEDKITDAVAPIIKRAEVFEIWNKADEEVIWLSRDFKRQPLDRKSDPLELEGFFPCPRPAYATLTTDSLLPVADYQQYRALADELDGLTERIQVLTEALKVAGIYDSSMEGLAALLADTTTQNIMIPVSNLAAYLSKGATGAKLNNVVQFFPVEEVARVVLSMYDARDRVKQTIFEMTGLSDIVRGQVDPREKLGQSRIKGQFASLRLDDKRQEIARVFRDMIRIKGEIIAEQFGDRMLREISGFDHILEIRNLLDQGPEGIAQADQLFQAATQLIRDDKARGFRIDIESDSTISVDEQETKESRIEFLTAAGGFLQQALLVGSQVPQMAPLLGEMLLFAVRGFKAGRPLEASFEDAIEELQQAQEQQQQQPDPEAQKAQAEAQKDQIELQTKRASAQIDIEKKKADLKLSQQKNAMELETARQEQAIRRQELALRERELAIRAAEIRQEAV